MEIVKIIKNNKSAYYEIKLNNNINCKIDIESLDKVLNVIIDKYNINTVPSWYSTFNGYIACSISKLPGNTLYIHRYLMNQIDYDGKISVDHINRDKTDNRLSNLRLATQSSQNHNRTLKERVFIKIDGFDVEIQLPQYIEYQKESKIKSTKDGKEIETILPAHFRIHSKYIGFDKHSTKSSKLTIKERLSNALAKRYNLIINSTKNITDLYIDGYQFNSNQEFEKHTIEYITVLCGLNIDKIPGDDDFLEDSRIKKSNIPKYVSYSQEKGNRGSQLTYDKNNKENKEKKERIMFSSSGSKYKSLDDKFEELISLMHKNNVEFVWNEKPNFIDDTNQIYEKKSKLELSTEWLNEIKKSRESKTFRERHNPIDIIIIQKLYIDFNKNINKLVTSYIMQLSDDRITKISNNETIIDNYDKIANDFIDHSNLNFITEYNKIKSEIEAETIKRKDAKKNGPKKIVIQENTQNKQEIKENNKEENNKEENNKEENNKEEKQETKIIPKPISIIKKGWKIDVITIINMLKDKGILTFNEIAEKYKDIEGNPISTSDVQNFCSNGPSYWLNKEDFEDDFQLTYEEYKSKREYNVRLFMSNKASENIKSKINNDDYLNICKTNSISKRTCDSKTMVDIFLDKYTTLSSTKAALKHKNKNGDQVTPAIVAQIWNGGTTLFESDFEGRDDISYSKYIVDVKEDKTYFTKDIENKEKYENLLLDIEQKKIKELTRTHIKYIKMFGKDEKFITSLRQKIRTQ